jgi:hypothetical protein
LELWGWAPGPGSARWTRYRESTIGNIRDYFNGGRGEDQPGSDAPRAYIKISMSVIIRNAISW